MFIVLQQYMYITQHIKRKWREMKYKDEQEQRHREAQLLQKELRVRQLSRHNREIQDEEQRRVRLGLEGLVLERRLPPREEFPGILNFEF
jgi:hypothetical protein